MKSSTVRIDDESHAILQEISKQEKEPMQRIVRKAVENYKRDLFLRKCNEAYSTLKSDTGAWKEELGEREAWDVTISDGLKEDK